MTSVVSPGGTATPLHRDLLELVEAVRRLEADLFGRLPTEKREVPGTIGQWSAKDAWTHVAAWRAIEARRLEAAAGSEPNATAGDPQPDEPVDVSNSRLHAERADWSWQAVADEAAASLDALARAITASTFDALCECDGTVAGIGANGVNHAIAHLSDVAMLADAEDAFAAFARDVEAVLRRNHLPMRDSGVMLYNLACHAALSGDIPDARRLLDEAVSRRHDLAETARDDPDLEALRSGDAKAQPAAG